MAKIKTEGKEYILANLKKKKKKEIAEHLGVSNAAITNFLVRNGYQKKSEKPRKNIITKYKGRHEDLRQFVLKKNFRNVSEAIKTIGRRELLEEFELHSREG